MRRIPPSGQIRKQLVELLGNGVEGQGNMVGTLAQLGAQLVVQEVLEWVTTERLCRGHDQHREPRAAPAGRGTLSSEAAQALAQATNQPPTPGHDLTERERDVLALMVDGLDNTQIAGKLVVSPSTIESHVSHILVKLGVASRTEAAALAVRHRLVT